MEGGQFKAEARNWMTYQQHVTLNQRLLLMSMVHNSRDFELNALAQGI